MSAQLTNSIQLLVTNVSNTAQSSASSNSYNNYDTDTDAFGAALDSATKSYADKTENKTVTQTNDYAKDTKDVQNAQNANNKNVKENTPEQQTDKTTQPQTDKTQTTASEKTEQTDNSTQTDTPQQSQTDVNIQNAATAVLMETTTKNVMANEQLLSNINCEQQPQQPEVKEVKPQTTVTAAETQIDSEVLKAAVENGKEQITADIDNTQTTVKNQQNGIAKNTVDNLASDMSKVTANVEVEQTAEPAVKVITPADTKAEEAPVIKVTQEVAANIEENINNIANNIENKDTTSKIKDKAVAQMTAMEDKNAVVTQTTAQESSSSNQQNNSGLPQNNAQEQVAKMSVEANSDTANLPADNQLNGSETFVSKMDAQLSAASKTSSSMQNTLNTNSIIEQVNKQFEQLQQSASNKVSIVLQPENLGRVSVEIMNTKDGITAKMMTDSQQVKDLFDKNIEALKSNLSAQGVNVNNIKVECTQESANNAMNFEREQFNQSFNNPNNSNHNQTNQSNSQTAYTNTDNMNFDEVETEINTGVEIKNTQTIIQHNGKVDYKV